MPTLSIDGVPIANINTSEANALKNLAQNDLGRLTEIEIRPSEPQRFDMAGAECGNVELHIQRCDVSLSLIFLTRENRKTGAPALPAGALEQGGGPMRAEIAMAKMLIPSLLMAYALAFLLTGCQTTAPVNRPCGVIEDSLKTVRATTPTDQQRLDIHFERGVAERNLPLDGDDIDLGDDEDTRGGPA